MKALNDGEAYQHLGVPTGFRVQQTPVAELARMCEDLHKVDVSPLAPWQKLDAVRTFLLPRLEFIMRGGGMKKTAFYKFDRKMKAAAKRWMSLPRRASAEVVYMPMAEGGAGLLPTSDSVDVLAVTHPFRLLTSSDPLCKENAWSSLKEVVRKRIGREPTVHDCCQFLSGSMVGDLGGRSNDFSSIWTRARNATRRLQTRIGCQWGYSEARDEIAITINMPNRTPDRHTIPPKARGYLANQLRNGLRHNYKERLLRKPDQGKVYRHSSKSQASNHCMSTGRFTRFCDLRFVTKARLDTVGLNGTRRYGNAPTHCRRCDYGHETLPHVLNSCRYHTAAWTKRHNAVLNRLVRAIPRNQANTIRVNQKIPNCDLRERPDLVITNIITKKACIVDVTVPAENHDDALLAARDYKIRKYTPHAEVLRSQGFETVVEAVVVGSLGSWDTRNDRIVKMLGIGKRYSTLMRKLMVSDTIRWSRDIFIEHVTGHRQYN